MTAAVPRLIQANTPNSAPQQPPLTQSLAPKPKHNRKHTAAKRLDTANRRQQQQQHQQQQQQPSGSSQVDSTRQHAAKPNRAAFPVKRAHTQPRAAPRTQQPNQTPPSAKNRQATGLHAQIMHTSSAWEVLELFSEHKQDFDTVNISTAFHRIAKVHWPDLSYPHMLLLV